MNYGAIRILTNPTGSTVHIDNIDKGTTPIDIVNVSPGIYNITLSYHGLNSYNFDTAVIDGKITIVQFNFILQEVNEDHIVLTGTDLIKIQPPPGLPEEQPPDIPEKREKNGVSVSEPEHKELAKHLADMNRILERNNSLMSNVNDGIDLLRQYIGKTSGFDPNERYYSTQQIAITVATPNKPDNSDSIANSNAVPPLPGYDRIPVYDVMNRNSRNISVINDGTTHLFVITSPDGKNFSAQENPILVGESRIFHNIYEMRIRSSSSGDLVTGLGGIYRVTEYDYSLSYSSTVLASTVNRPSFVTRIVNAPLVGVLLPNIPIANGFALSIRANVNNGLGFVYVADTIVNATNAAVPGFRITLAAGDTLRIFLTNANLVAIASSTGAENVDIIVET